MKVLMNVSFPPHVFNAAVKAGTAGATMQRILEATRPEAAYFTEQHRRRGAVLVYELSDAAKIPALAEPWMLAFEAEIELRPVMTADELARAGLDEFGKTWI